MHDIRPEDQASLRQDLREARARVDQLVEALHGVDSTLGGLELERSKFRLVEAACDALEALEATGSSALFWAGRDPGIPVADHLRQARSRFEEFAKQLSAVEERRQSLLEEIELQQLTADRVAGDILDAERIAEEKKFEWMIEREVAAQPVRPSIMPWARSQEDDRRFRRTLFATLLASALFGYLLPLIDIPMPERWEILEEQERLTELVREPIPVPPVVVAEEKPVEAVEPDAPAESSDDSPAPTLADKAQAESNPAPAATKQPTGSRGILAFREKFSGLAKNDEVERLGSNAQIEDPTAVADGLPQRSLVTSDAPGASGGINVAALSRGTGGTGTQLSGVAVTRATSTFGSGSGNGTGNGTGSGKSGKGRGGDRPMAGSSAANTRTDEEIQIVFDRHKSALYRLYNRELRQDPTLKGQMVLRLTIQPDGSVSFCEVKSTDMKAPQLASQVVERVKTFDFGAKPGIAAVTIVYPIDFLPAT
jgi:hypothetical protein